MPQEDDYSRLVDSKVQLLVSGRWLAELRYRRAVLGWGRSEGLELLYEGLLQLEGSFRLDGYCFGGHLGEEDVSEYGGHGLGCGKEGGEMLK